MYNLSVSVKVLVRTALRKGHIDNRYVGKNRMEEGSKIHRLLQGNYSENDRSEMVVSTSWEKEGININISGRIDGVLDYETEKATIEEIKSTNISCDDLEEPFLTHLAQAKIYAYIYSKDHSLEKINVRMT